MDPTRLPHTIPPADWRKPVGPAHMRVAAVTGHRPGSLDGDHTCSSRLWQHIRTTLANAIDQHHIHHLLIGMAIGVDQTAAQVAIDRNINWTACVPFADQPSRWPQPAQQQWWQLLQQADQVIVVSNTGYTPAVMHIRNHWMVDHADMLLAVWDQRNQGGTTSCVQYAQRRQTQIWHIPPDRHTQPQWLPDRPARHPRPDRSRQVPGQQQLF